MKDSDSAYFIVQHGALCDVGSLIGKRPSRIFLVSDYPIHSLYGKRVEAAVHEQFPGLPITTFLAPSGEEGKSWDIAHQALGSLSAAQGDPNTLVLALGGGCITDLGGFIAAIYMRGLRLVSLPTTLLSMVDAAIGGKNGINFDGVKNLVGTLRHPERVIIDPAVLKTQPARHLRSGLAEIIKIAAIADGDFFYQLQTLDFDLPSIIERACQLKMAIVEKSASEPEVRHLLNFGHTYGHAIESLTGFSLYTHGEAVSMGMSLAAALAADLSLCSPELPRQLDAMLNSASLPTEVPEVDISLLLQLMKRDKKCVDGRLTLVLPTAFGEGKMVTGISEADVVDSFLRKKGRQGV